MYPKRKKMLMKNVIAMISQSKSLMIVEKSSVFQKINYNTFFFLQFSRTKDDKHSYSYMQRCSKGKHKHKAETAQKICDCSTQHNFPSKGNDDPFLKHTFIIIIFFCSLNKTFFTCCKFCNDGHEEF